MSSEFDDGWADDVAAAQAVMGETVADATLTLRGDAVAGVVSPVVTSTVQGAGGKRSVSTFEVFLTPEVAAAAVPAKGDAVVARGQKARVAAVEDMAAAGVRLECAAFHARSGF